MTSEEWIRVLFSFLGGGLIVALLDWFRSISAERVSRRVEFLSQQLQTMYGPLYFFATQNESICKLGSVIHNAYTEEYCKPNWSQDKDTQINLDKETRTTLDIGNRYTEVMINNNDRMVEILVANYALIDPEDADVFQEFLVDVLRNKTEAGDKPGCETPRRIYAHLGDIAFYRSTYGDRIKQRFSEKTSELARWRRVGKFRWPWPRPKAEAT
jgi:hypothetical protein